MPCLSKKGGPRVPQACATKFADFKKEKHSQRARHCPEWCSREAAAEWSGLKTADYKQCGVGVAHIQLRPPKGQNLSLTLAPRSRGQGHAEQLQEGAVSDTQTGGHAPGHTAQFSDRESGRKRKGMQREPADKFHYDTWSWITLGGKGFLCIVGC